MSGGIAAGLPVDFEQATAHIVGAIPLPGTPRSPLRYPGGKSRAVATIRDYLPDHLEAICSPFLGGGSLELSCAAAGIAVYGSDAFAPVVAFWQRALAEPVLLAEQVLRHYPVSKTKFYRLQRNWHSLDSDLDRAAIFFVLNRCSFSGTTLSGGMSPEHPRFTPSAIDRLRDFRAPNLRVECMDYKEALEEHSDKFLYLDPPYANGGKLYGKKGDMHDGFDHAELAGTLRQREGWVLSYNDCEEVRALYAGYKIVSPEWTYGMNGDKVSSELLIFNV